MIRFAVPYLIYSVAALACIFLQSELFNPLQIFHAKPDLLLIILVFSALKTDWKNGVALGLLLGFWLDLFNGMYFGSSMVTYGLIGAAFGFLGTRFPDRTYEGYFFSVTAAALLSGFLMLTVLNLVGAGLPTGQSVFGIIFPMTFYTALITFFCLPVVFFYRRRKGRKIGRIDLIGNGVIYVRGDEKVDLNAVKERRKRSALRREKQERRATHRNRRERGARPTADRSRSARSKDRRRVEQRDQSGDIRRSQRGDTYYARGGKDSAGNGRPTRRPDGSSPRDPQRRPRSRGRK